LVFRQECSQQVIPIPIHRVSIVVCSLFAYSAFDGCDSATAFL
jgi:hypothetical protein